MIFSGSIPTPLFIRHQRVHYNGSNSFLFVDATKINKFKAKDSEIKHTVFSRDLKGRRMRITANSSVLTFVIKNLKKLRCANLLVNWKSYLLFILSQWKVDMEKINFSLWQLNQNVEREQSRKTAKLTDVL